MNPMELKRRVLKIERGTDQLLVDAAELRARMATRRLRNAGWDSERIVQEVVGDFRAELEAESFGTYEDETLMAAVQRGVEGVLSEARISRDKGESNTRAVG